MIYLLKEDYFEVYLASMISNNDKDVIFMLYQPILGHDAVALYFTLYSEFKKQENVYFSTHESLSEIMNLPLNRIQEARRMLEGIGLLQTYYQKDDNQTMYKYLLFSPKTPGDFFNDVLLRGLLTRSIGAKRVNQLANIYKSKDLKLDGFVEISETFTNVFHPDLDSKSFQNNVNIDRTFTHKTKDITKGFDRGLFLKSLEEIYQVKANVINKSDLNEISRIALLYGIEEPLMSEFVSQAISDDNVIDFEMVKKACLRDQIYAPIRSGGAKSKELFDGKSDKAQKIELMSTTSAFDFLKIKQNNTAVSPSDIFLINELAEKYGLNSQVINPLIDYVLENYDNTLPKNLVFKIAASLSRNNVETTLDAMNYLYKVKKSKKTVKNYTNDEQINEEVTDEDIAKLLDEIGDN